MVKINTNEDGFTLIEIIVSILLISIILFSFFGLLVQSKKTNSSAEDTNDATYLAQIEMEKIYNLSTQNNINLISSINLDGYIQTDTTSKSCSNNEKLDFDKEYIYERIIENSHWKSVVIIRKLCGYADRSTNVIIQIIDSKNNVKAMVENVYFWKK